MTTQLEYRAAHVIGRYHMQRQANSQDAYAISEYNGHIVGLVCDGCGEGQHSEVGAKLAAQYMHGQIIQMLNMNVPITDIPDKLYANTTQFLNYIVAGLQTDTPTQVVTQYLLFTVVGVIVSDKGGLIFSAGDGIHTIDDTTTVMDMNNQPPYIAYHLLDPQTLGRYIMPTGFDVQSIPETWQRVAIATDGLEDDLIPQIWEVRGKRGLQRKLNYWSNEEHRLIDDTTVITVEKRAST